MKATPSSSVSGRPSLRAPSARQVTFQTVRLLEVVQQGLRRRARASIQRESERNLATREKGRSRGRCKRRSLPVRRAGNDGRYYLPADAQHSYLFGLSSARAATYERGLHLRKFVGEKELLGDSFETSIERFQTTLQSVWEKATHASRPCVVLVTRPACRVTVSRHLTRSCPLL